MNSILLFCVACLHEPDYRTDDRFPGVCIQDIWEFGANKDEARFCYHQARKHISFYDERIRENYQFSTYMDWKAEANKCLMAWDYLDNCFIVRGDDWYDVIWKLQNLENLKRIIGEEAYNSRRMPPPCPQMFE